MKVKNYLVLLVIFFYTIEDYKSQNQDLTIIIKESVLNKMIRSMGEIKGTSSYSFMFIEGTYDWSLVNSRFNIHPGRLDFIH